MLNIQGIIFNFRFYDKIEHRYKIVLIVKYLWNNTQHRNSFKKIGEDHESFVRFANGLMNHTNHLIAEALPKIKEMKDIEDLKDNIEEWNKLSSQERQEKEDLYNSHKESVSSSLQLANETLDMMNYLSTEIRV